MQQECREIITVEKRTSDKGKLIGRKTALAPPQVSAIRIRSEMAENKRDLAMFNLALDSQLRGCDLVRLRVADIQTGHEIRSRAKVIQKKTGKPVQFEITKNTRKPLID